MVKLVVLSAGRAGRLRLEAPSCLYTAVLQAPEPRSCRLSLAVQLWSLSEAPPKPAVSQHLATTNP